MSNPNLPPVADRLRTLRKFLSLTQSQMAELMSIGQNSYSMIETGRVSLTERNRTAIVDKLHVNPRWLDHGLGAMFVPHAASALQAEATPGIPYHPSSEWLSGGAPECLISVPVFGDCTMFRRVEDCGMSPRYNPGDIVACRRVDPGNGLLYGEPHLCVVRNDEGLVELLRTIRRGPEPGTVTLKPASPDYLSVDVKVADISEIYAVRGKIVPEPFA